MRLGEVCLEVGQRGDLEARLSWVGVLAHPLPLFPFGRSSPTAAVKSLRGGN